MSDQQVEQQAEQQAEAQPAQLQISDILLATQSIQLASTRGAFRAEEFTQVGGLYERLVAFLKDSGVLQQTQASSAPTSESVESTTE